MSVEEPYTQGIFKMSKSLQEYAKAFQAKKAVQDYAFTDEEADGVERRWACNGSTSIWTTGASTSVNSSPTTSNSAPQRATKQAADFP
jgi:hypothetical protein